jgi:serine/threonine-protein kinase RsbT
MSDLRRTLEDTLRRYLSEILAQSLLRRALVSAGVPDGELRAEQVPLVSTHLEAGLRLFVDPSLQGPLMREILTLSSGPVAPPAAERHPVLTEADVSVVRMRARELALAMGAGALGVQRLATATSELARNAVAYAGGGFIELIPERDGFQVTLCAVDAGKGIPNLEEVLSGRYRSRTGLGKGLLGVRRLSRRFDVQTSIRGTRIEAEIAL